MVYVQVLRGAHKWVNWRHENVVRNGICSLWATRLWREIVRFRRSENRSRLEIIGLKEIALGRRHGKVTDAKSDLVQAM